MCGINGIIGFGPINGIKDKLQRMNDSLAHRGPDDAGVVIDENVGLGHRRLSIIDLSDAGHQPMVSQDGRYVLVYNGELYNYRELREQLSNDHAFTTQTDTEVVLAAFKVWGRDCLQRFNGMFAICIWDKVEKRYFLARDRMGIKPLYYSATDQGLVFSSETRSMLASGMVKRLLNNVGFADYLRYQTVHAPDTIIQDVHLLQPGYFLSGVEDEWSLHRYWDPATAASGPQITDAQEARKLVREQFFSAVEKRLVADVPFGAFLSGGIDSSAVVGAMAEVATKTVKTFSITFDEEEFSEAKYARIIAEKFKTDHHEIRLKPVDFLDVLPDALSAMDHPTGDGTNTYIVSKVTKEAGITMALSGLGGDELFAGYDIFKRSLDLEKKRWLQSFPKLFRNMGGNLLRLVKRGVASEKIAALLQLDYLDLPYTYPINRQMLLDPMIHRLTGSAILPGNTVFKQAAAAIGYGTPGFDLPALSQVSLLEMQSYMQNLLLRDTDQMAMAHALEVRVPFLDHELVALALRISDEVKFPHTPKQLLCESLGDLLPRSIVDRPKMGFTLPFSEWMKNDLHSFCQQRIHNLADSGLVEGNVLLQFWKRFVKGDSIITWSRMWYLVVLQHWMEQNDVSFRKN